MSNAATTSREFNQPRNKQLNRRFLRFLRGRTPVVSVAVNKPLLNVLNGQREKDSAGLDDAAGRPLSARIPCNAREGRFVPRSVLQSGTRRRSDAAADPQVRFRRARSCSPIFWSSRYALGRKVDFVAGEGPQLEPIVEPQIGRGRSAARSITGCSTPVYETIRRVKPQLPERCDVSRLLRRALDGRDLHDRRARARPTRRRRGCSPIGIRMPSTS